MSDEIKPEDNEATRRYSLWRDLSANARFPSEDFVARAALHSRSERNPDEGLSQFRSEYPLQETAGQVSGTVALPPLPPDRTSAVNAKMAAAVTALFVVGFAAAVGLKQWQNAPATVVAQAPSSQSRPVDAPSTSPLDTLPSAEPVDVPPDSSASQSIAPAESAAVVSEPPAPPAKAPIARTPSLADTRASSTSADASTTPQPDRPAAALSANARSIAASTPPIPPAPVTAPDPAPSATNRETAVNATATGPVDVAVPAAAVRNTPVATTGGDVPAVASAPAATDADLRPAPVDRPVSALSSAAPAPIAAPTVTPAAAIQRTLQGYQSAFSRLDVNAVRQVWPSVDQKALAKAFDQLKSEDLTLENCKVTVTGANAVAACGGKTEYVPKIGSKNARVERHQWRISLQQVADRWVVHQVDVTAP